MAVYLSPVGGAAAQFFTNTGAVLTGGKLYTYLAGTTTPTPTYTTSAGNVARTNPIVLDAAGRVPGSGEIWITVGITYKFVLTDSNDVLIGTYDNISSQFNTDASLVTYTPAGTGAVTTTVQAKLRQYVSVKDFGAVGDGTTDDTAAIQLAVNNNKGVFFPEGSYLISSPIELTQQWVYGVGSDKSIILCSATHAFTVLSNAGFDRPACVVEKLGINSIATSCDSKFAFYVPGVASGAAAVYNSGLTIRDIEIGRTGRMGGGFYLKDLFRCNIEDVGLTGVSRMIQVVGSVVQLRASRVISNNDSAGSALNKYGISTESASYSDGTLGPENCVFENCAYIRGNRGISHTSGLMIYFTNFDTEADAYGAFVAAQCTIQGGIFAPGIAANDWTGIYRSSGVSEAYDGTYFIDVDVNTLRAPTAPLSSFGFDFGDGTSPVYGVIMQNCRVRGTPSSLNHAIRGRQCRDALIEGTSIESAICSGTEVLFTLVRGLNFNFNRVVGGVVDITDDGDTSATGSVLNNQVGTISLTLTFPANNNWIIGGNTTTETASFFGWNISKGTNTNTVEMTDSGQNEFSITTSNDGNVTFRSNNDTGAAYGEYRFNARNGVGTLTRAFIDTSGNTKPGADNTYSLGDGSYRWSTVYAATGAINTSDERVKDIKSDGIDSRVLAAWGKVNYSQFKFKDAVQEKGDNARWHIGLIAQQIKAAFESEGLDAFEYGLLCYDKWDDIYIQEMDIENKPTGNMILDMPAGDRYGVRYEEALALECAYLRNKLTGV